jgi:hypothetical protein
VLEGKTVEKDRRAWVEELVLQGGEYSVGVE